MSEASDLFDDAPLDGEDEGAPVPWATWLDVSSKRLKRDADERAAILEEAEIEPARWTMAERHWNLRIAEGLAAGDYSLSDQLAAACVRELAGRRQAPSDSASPSGARGVVAGGGAVRGSAAVGGDTSEAIETPGAAPTPPAVVPLMATSGGDLKPSFLLQKSPSLQAAAAPPATSPRSEPAIPAPAATAPPVVPSAAPARRTPLDMGTAIGVIPGVPVLPFAASAPAGDAALARAKQHAEEVQSPAPIQNTPIGETEAVDVGALARRVLAFGPQKSAAESAPAPSPPVAGASPTHGPKVAAVAPAQPSALPTLTVEQYASLCVDLELAPGGSAEALRRYGVTPEGKRALDEGFGRVFAEQPSRHAAFEHAKATYRAWLTRGGR